MISTGVFSSTYSSVPPSKLSLFFLPSHPLLPGAWVSFEHQFHSCGTSSVFRKLFQPVNSRLGGHSSSLFFSGGFNRSFSLSIIFFPSAQIFPFARSPLASLSFRSVQDIPGDSSVFQLIRGCHLIQIFQLFRCIIYLFNNPFQRCFSL